MRSWRESILKFSLLSLTLLTLGASSSRLHQPALNQDFPDPGIVKTPDAWYYAYATQAITEDKSKKLLNIQMARSRDLKIWQFLGEALPVKPTWASFTQFFWAPDVSYHDGTYFMYFSALPDTTEGFCIGVATSKDPAGPFVDSGEPLICGPSFTTIDPMSFDDPETGERILYWGSGFDAIKAQALAEDRIHFQKGTKPIEVISPTETGDLKDYRRLLEGAWVLQKEGFYYLFTSGDSCCSPAHYAVLVARSRSAWGPFEFQAHWQDSLLLQADEQYLAPGHNSVVEDEAGRSWILYHAIDRDHPELADKIPNDRKVRRILMLQELDWEQGWPRLKESRKNDRSFNELKAQ
jgi:arabinan endo-1,5-alpha-L-arabinosidase